MKVEDINLKELIENETGLKFNRNNKISCLFHSDTTPSFSYNPKINKMHCFSCGRSLDAIDFIQEIKKLNYYEACKYLNIDLKGKAAIVKNEKDKVKSFIDWQLTLDEYKDWKLVDIYRFEDESDKTLYFTGKFTTTGKKEIRYYHINTDGKVKFGRGDNVAVPYRFKSLLEAIKNKKAIFICEGEKDVKTLSYLGYAATSFKGVKDFDYKIFKGIIVNFVGDTGAAGEEYKESVYSKIKNYASLFNIIKLTGIEDLGDNADITDWLKAGHTKEEFAKIISNCFNDDDSRRPPYIDKKGKVKASVLADVVESDTLYKQYMKNDYKYNGEYYEKIKDVEHIQREIKQYIPKESQTTRVINETLNLLRIDNTVNSSTENEFISVNNGLVNVKTKELIPHTPEVFSLFKVPCDYEPEKAIKKFKTSRFKQYLDTTFGDDEETKILISEVLGASLLPNPKLFKKVIFLLGEGSNGKSVFIDILQALHGNIFSAVPLKDIDSNRFALSSMIGMKINVDADASGTRLEETSNFKKLATGDVVSIEEKGKPSVYNELNILMVIGLNKMPSTQDKSYGFVRRNIIIPFKNTFVDPSDKESISKGCLPIDDTLASDILNKEMDIVLCYALSGLSKLLKNNYRITKSKAVEEATKEYTIENDSVMAFYEDNRYGYEHEKIAAKVIYTEYEKWCENNERTPCTQTSFGQRFKNYYNHKRTNTGVIYFNVRLNNKNNI